MAITSAAADTLHIKKQLKNHAFSAYYKQKIIDIDALF